MGSDKRPEPLRKNPKLCEPWPAIELRKCGVIEQQAEVVHESGSCFGCFVANNKQVVKHS